MLRKMALVRPSEHILEVHPSARVVHVGGVGEMSVKSFMIDSEKARIMLQ